MPELEKPPTREHKHSNFISICYSMLGFSIYALFSCRSRTELTEVISLSNYKVLHHSSERRLSSSRLIYSNAVRKMYNNKVDTSLTPWTNYVFLWQRLSRMSWLDWQDVLNAWVNLLLGLINYKEIGEIMLSAAISSNFSFSILSVCKEAL